jgi:outer membrane protein TolC
LRQPVHSRFALIIVQKLNHKIQFLALAIASLLGACAMQTYAPQPIQPAQSEAGFRARSLDSVELRDYMLAQGYPQASVPVAAWGLHELTLAAFFYHPQLDLVRARWREAQVAIVTAGAKANPGVAAGAEHHSRNEGGISPWTLGFSFDIPIETGDKRAIRIEQASHLSEAARIEIGQTAWQVRRDLRDRLLDYHVANEQITVLQTETSIRGEIVNMLETRSAAGLISSTELGSARLQLQSAQQQLQAAQGHSAELRAQVAAAAGLPAQALTTAKLDSSPLHTLPAWEQLPAEASQRAALLNRLDLRAALARYAAAESALQLEIAKQRPDITLSPGYSFDQGDNRWSLGLSLILALLNKNEGPIAAASARRETEAASFDVLQASIIAEQEQALAKYRVALDEIAAAERSLQSQRQQQALTARQFEAGYSDRLELAGVRLEAVSAERHLLSRRIKAKQALGTLEDALQQPLDETTLPDLPGMKEPHA